MHVVNERGKREGSNKIINRKHYTLLKRSYFLLSLSRWYERYLAICIIDPLLSPLCYVCLANCAECVIRIFVRCSLLWFYGWRNFEFTAEPMLLWLIASWYVYKKYVINEWSILVHFSRETKFTWNFEWKYINWFIFQNIITTFRIYVYNKIYYIL